MALSNNFSSPKPDHFHASADDCAVCKQRARLALSAQRLAEANAARVNWANLSLSRSQRAMNGLL